MKPSIQIIIFAIVLVISAVYCLHYFGGYEEVADGNDYAALARNIVHGNGFLVNHIYPLSLKFYNTIPQADNLWAPGYPIYLTLWFTLFGASDRVAIWASIMAVWLFMLAVYLLGRKVGGSTMGILAAALAGLSQFVLRIAIEGTPEIITAILLILSVYILLYRQNIRHIIFSAILFGLAALSRYQITILAIPLVILFIEDKKQFLAPWIIVMILTLTPWFIRNWIVLGNPFFTLQTYGEFTKGMGRFNDYYFTYRSFTPMTFWYALSHFPLAVAKKFVGGIFMFTKSFPGFFNFLGVIPFFYLFFKLDKIQGIEKKIFLFSLISVLLIVIPASFAGAHDRHLLPLQGFLLISMLFGFQYLIRDFGIDKKPIAFAVATAILFLPAKAATQEKELAAVAAKCQKNMSAYGEIRKITDPNDIVISDASDAVWWYSERNSVWIPTRYSDLKELIYKFHVGYIYLNDPPKYLNKFVGDNINDFNMSVEAVPEFSGPGVLYRVNNARQTPNNLM